MFDDQDNTVLDLFMIHNEEGPGTIVTNFIIMLVFTIDVMEWADSLPILDIFSLMTTPSLLQQFNVLFSCNFNFSELVFIGAPVRC
jgi:hypothetical protein